MSEELFAGEKIEKWEALGLAEAGPFPAGEREFGIHFSRPLGKQEATSNSNTYGFTIGTCGHIYVYDNSTGYEFFFKASYSLASELVKNFKSHTKGER